MRPFSGRRCELQREERARSSRDGREIQPGWIGKYSREGLRASAKDGLAEGRCVARTGRRSGAERKFGAGGGNRTHDTKLGKLLLYH